MPKINIEVGQIWRYNWKIYYAFRITKVTKTRVESIFLGRNGYSDLNKGEHHSWEEWDGGLDTLRNSYTMIGYDKPHLWKKFYSTLVDK